MPSRLFPSSDQQEEFRATASTVISNTRENFVPSWDLYNQPSNYSQQNKSIYNANAPQEIAEDELPPNLSIYESDQTIDMKPQKPIDEPNDKFASLSLLSSGEPLPVNKSDGWVTLFGFYDSQTPHVLRYFQSIGEIIKSEQGSGNFVHVKFRTKLQQQKAIQRNGKLIEDGLMIGVIERIEPPKNHPQKISVNKTMESFNKLSVQETGSSGVPRNSFFSKIQEYVWGG